MAKPRIFISSTFYDLKQVRSSLEVFVRSMGFDPVLSEKGSIAYSPDVPLDESCYREAQGCDVFVLIIGGRYGSEISKEKQAESESQSKGFYDRYESITRKEYESALQRDIPTYVLVEKAVHAEYEIFKLNRENQTIKYPSVNSVNIFTFIDYVLSRPRNSPVFPFELSSEIETWLREQWAGLFRDLIRTRADRAQISSLADRVTDLSNISTTLKRYLEAVVSQVGSKEKAKEIIDEERARLSEARELSEIAKIAPIETLKTQFNIPIQDAKEVFTKATSFENLARRLEDLTGGKLKAKSLIPFWKSHLEWADTMNEVRTALNLPLITFAENQIKSGPKRPAKAKSDNEKNA